MLTTRRHSRFGAESGFEVNKYFILTKFGQFEVKLPGVCIWPGVMYVRWQRSVIAPSDVFLFGNCLPRLEERKIGA